ncbi:hypothetical protein RN001_012921 [Aquatica leii]|uniref:Uncharacterized protein n=1 Tax=Aquatica leii TaxID=1421715 RepID=A0AAN7P3M3_9COLE|nr:hypothetical protein RN001_012921 [Aquatica leii]
MSRRFIFFILCAILANLAVPCLSINSQSIKTKIVSSTFFDYNETLPSNSSVADAFVLNSNLPLETQLRLASALTFIYKTEGNPIQRLLKFQKETTKMYSYAYWNVVSNFGNITYYSQCYIYLQMNNDRIFAFGLITLRNKILRQLHCLSHLGQQTRLYDSLCGHTLAKMLRSL